MSTTEKGERLSQTVIEAKCFLAEMALKHSDYEYAVQIYREILDLTDSGLAAYQMGALCAMGKGTKQDFLEAAYWFFQAQNQGKEEAGRLLAKSTLDYFRQDLDRLTPELLWKKAVSFSERVFGEQETRAASISCLKQMVNFCIEKEDFENEVKIVRALAEYGKDAESQNRMGVLYNRGIGLERNDLAALYWFNKAEEQGEAAAGTDCDGIFQAYCRNLGREDFAEQIGLLAHWCRTGRGPVPLDRERGAYWTGRMEKILTGPDRKGRPEV